MSSIYTASVSQLSELKDIFIELTAKNCNMRCRDCYIDFPFQKKVKDFIKTDIIKKMLSDTRTEKIRCIYLTGAEPMTHPDFNSILRLCLKRTNVCIMTNASLINEKKSRFLKSVENESPYQIFFKLSFAHYDELQNDTVRSRGAYRQNIYAIKCLDKYDFMNIICVSNFYKEPHDLIVEKFQQKLETLGIENAIIQVGEWVTKNADTDITDLESPVDCQTSRTLTSNGVFSCPFLANDYRGRLGSDFTDYSKTVRLETNYCATCIKNKDKIFSVDVDW